MFETKRGISSFPAPFARALANDQYDPGHSWMTVTGLLSPPQKTFLSTKGEKIESGYMATMSIFGTAIHNVLEKNVDPAAGEFAEVRFYKDILGKTIGGKIDHYEPGVVHDWKVTSGVTDAAKPDHRNQAQLNGYLVAENGHRVEQVAVNYFDRGWSYLQSTLNPAYPSTAFTAFVFPYDRQFAEDLFHLKIREHMDAKAGNPRPCTPEEQWAKPDTFALMKPGAKRASKVCSTLAEAEEEKKPGQFIQPRKGERTYCLHFCGLKHICPQFAREEALRSNDKEEP